MGKKLLSQRHPIFYFLAVWEKRLVRYFKWYIGREKYSFKRTEEDLEYRVKAHQSLLMRKLGDSDMKLQQNKIQNLKTALKKIDGIHIYPGETFSFWRLIGFPTKKKGYVSGMVLSRGEVKEGTGGGLCQLSNLLHWMVLHSPLIIKERAHHSFDPFPDNGRVLPFGSGAAVFYNYVDLQFVNNTPYVFQIRLNLTETHLKGELRSNNELTHSYHIYEKGDHFQLIGNKHYRKNEIWRKVFDKNTGNLLEKQLMIKNYAEVKYTPLELKDINELNL